MPLISSSDFPIRSVSENRSQDRFFKQKIAVFAENSRYYLETAKTTSTLIELFKLRHQVFSCKSAADSGLDYDRFDWIFDHLVIREKTTGTVCGTYRICSQNNTDRFYSEGEFEMSELLNLPGNKIEVGRAAIQEEHRNGLVLDLLWRGIGQYIVQTNATFVFGCSSVMSTSSTLAHELSSHFTAQGHTDAVFNTRAKAEYRPNALHITSDIYTESDLESMIPALISSYLRAGATLGPCPAIDMDFGSIDFLTILDVAQMHSGYKKRYLK
jgi:putative hemolysin